MQLKYQLQGKHSTKTRINVRLKYRGNITGTEIFNNVIVKLKLNIILTELNYQHNLTEPERFNNVIVNLTSENYELTLMEY